MMGCLRMVAVRGRLSCSGAIGRRVVTMRQATLLLRLLLLELLEQARLAAVGGGALMGAGGMMPCGGIEKGCVGFDGSDGAADRSGSDPAALALDNALSGALTDGGL